MTPPPPRPVFSVMVIGGNISVTYVIRNSWGQRTETLTSQMEQHLGLRGKTMDKEHIFRREKCYRKTRPT